MATRLRDLFPEVEQRERARIERQVAAARQTRRQALEADLQALGLAHELRVLLVEGLCAVPGARLRYPDAWAARTAIIAGLVAAGADDATIVRALRRRGCALAIKRTPADAERLQATLTRLRTAPAPKTRPVGVVQPAAWERRQADTLAGALRHVARRHPWVGTASELLAALDALGPRFTRCWPKGPQPLGVLLRHLAPALRARGIAVGFQPRGAYGQRLISLARHRV